MADDIAPNPEQEAHWEWLYRSDFAGGAFGKDWKFTREPDNVGRAMREGVPPPAMLIDEWLVQGVLHWLYADAEAGKTWLALIWAVEVLRQGRAVVWIDEEIGVREIAGRLNALGADPDAVERLFVYYSAPGYRMRGEGGQADIVEWRRTLREVRPALVVMDTATDMLSQADMDEDKGKDITAWVAAYCDPAREVEATTVVLDHTGKGGAIGKHAVGSRGKRAKAKVQYGMKTVRGYDRNRIGRVWIDLTKNTLGAEIPPGKRTFECGGEAGRFIWREAGAEPGGDGYGSELRMHHDIMQALAVGPLNTSQIKAQVTGKSQSISDALAEMASPSSLWPVKATPKGSSTVYELVPEAPAGDATTEAP